MMSKGLKFTIPAQRQKGAMIVVTLIILLIVSVLGMASMDTTGLEMRMASNTRDQQQAFEAAEYTLSWVQNEIGITGFSTASLSNTACGSICFEPTCSNGYCFQGSNPLDQNSCELATSHAANQPDPAGEIYATEAIWTNAARHRTLAVPNIGVTTRYIVEFRCYTALDPSQPMDDTNFTRVYRITVLAAGPAGRGRVMLRSTIRST